MNSMKRLMPIITLLFSLNVMGMHVLGKRVGSIKTYNPHTFGRTHFIRGYSAPAQLSPLPKKEIIIDQRPPIIDESSVHLIDESRLVQSFCSLEHNLSSIVLSVLERAEKTINLAAFSLTDKRIADQLIAAHKRGVDVCVIMDPGNMKQAYSKGQNLIDNGVSVWRYDPTLRSINKKKNTYEELMHLKWLIVDDKLIEGSANFTKAAQDGYNVEGITMCRCPQLVQERRRLFNRLKSYCRECKKDVPAKA